MEYEQKYNAALERAKEYHDNGGAPLILEAIFPELKESEGENMRKSIIYALRNGGFYSSDKTDEAISWLEKQGHMLDPDKVIAWIRKYWPFSCGNFALLADDAIKKFKKDFEI